MGGAIIYNNTLSTVLELEIKQTKSSPTASSNQTNKLNYQEIVKQTKSEPKFLFVFVKENGFRQNNREVD